MQTKLTDNQVLDLRAKERTLDGAYFRTSIALLGASLFALRLFDNEVRSLAVIFISFSIFLFILDQVRRNTLKKFRYLDNKERNNQIESSNEGYLKTFCTSGNIVAAGGFAAIIVYIAVLFVLWSKFF